MFKVIFVTVVAMVFSGCVGVEVDKKSMELHKINNLPKYSSDVNKNRK